MVDYTWPSTLCPKTSSLSWHDNTVPFESPLSGQLRTESRPGSKWNISMVFDAQKNKAQIANPLQILEAFCLRLNGKEHRTIMGDPAYERSGPGGGTPVVAGAGQTGLTLNTSGWPNSTVVLYAGDRIGVSNQILTVIDDVTSSPSGLATLVVHSNIRIAPSDLAAIEIDNPVARWVLMNKFSLAARPGIYKTVMLEFEEAIP